MARLTNQFENLLARLQHPQVAFEPISDDDDELTQAITNDVHAHENDWELKDIPDGDALGAFWDEVLAELGPEKVEDSDSIDE